jgi:UDP-N-acetylmuramate dehydrogenase
MADGKKKSDGWEALKTLAGFSGDLLFSEPLAKHTYFKIGGPAAALAVPRSESDLEILRKAILQDSIPFRVIGLGSNLLAPDAGIDALIVKTTKLNSSLIEATAEGVRIGAGVAVAALLRKAASEGWDGFESISGIPGTIGGVVAMNGGTHLGEAAERILSVRTFDFETVDVDAKTHSGKALSFSYRKNHFLQPGELVLEALWRVEHGDPTIIREKLDALYRRRKETQPLDFPSCGSVFKNPRDSGLRAWEVVEKLGLRGHRIGNAQIAEKHPNWILNLGGAKAVDVLGLIDLVKFRAKAELGIEMQEEVKILA